MSQKPRCYFNLSGSALPRILRVYLILLLYGLMPGSLSALTNRAEICIYGGTSAGVIAAMQAAKMNKTVLVIEPGRHLGGMSSAGLGWTDIGNKAAIGGLAREFYARMGRHYGKSEAWTFAPSVAEKEFNAMIRDHGIPVYFQQQIAAVTKDGNRLRSLTTQNGDIFLAKMFIDASYEGDLMARSGVTYFVGREANTVYGETLNGIRNVTPHHQFNLPVDPYVKPGLPSSGLLPFVQPDSLGKPGMGDRSVQAYNFRLCLTKNPQNWKKIDPPSSYDPAQYELFGRYFDALAAANKKVALKNFLKIDFVDADKTDINNQGAFSTDFIGGNHEYPEADFATRERIKAAHLDYTKGLLTYLATSPRVPSAVRREMQAWGLCKDEFVDSGGWPNQMYVREARRMVASCVMTEKNCRHIDTVTDSVGLAAYTMDSHNCRRLVRNGLVENEGDVQVRPADPYPISLGAIVPQINQCENLLVPVCLSASHIAYGSIRMEPVFMVLGQSAATAAVLAIEENQPVQRVNYTVLRDRLLADKQILVWKGK